MIYRHVLHASDELLNLFMYNREQDLLPSHENKENYLPYIYIAPFR